MELGQNKWRSSVTRRKSSHRPPHHFASKRHRKVSDKFSGPSGRCSLQEATGSIRFQPSTDMSAIFRHHSLPCRSLDCQDGIDKLTHLNLSFRKHSPPRPPGLSLLSLWPFEGELMLSTLPWIPRGCGSKMSHLANIVRFPRGRRWAEAFVELTLL